jgi:hypothetical protein
MYFINSRSTIWKFCYEISMPKYVGKIFSSQQRPPSRHKSAKLICYSLLKLCCSRSAQINRIWNFAADREMDTRAKSRSQRASLTASGKRMTTFRQKVRSVSFPPYCSRLISRDNDIANRKERKCGWPILWRGS